MGYTLTARLMERTCLKPLQLTLWEGSRLVTQSYCAGTVSAGREHVEDMAKRYQLDAAELINQIHAQLPKLPPY
ncbi:MAG: hypothetical protein A2921_00490 [Candidatus Magasanikbacteria bacterium RIFCSPLOWO2_01_FULL_43_20b]|uniref:Uncharacterized protein n=1 Tax=Candidatus Magasanikbacteria bacterium RIFCSPLOWO2_12_FULL_43_12 TaxID=1798692 RepID=A0A1F6MVE0_9BACT|nr:MAG: hypothetical protein A3I93_02745 [Candidatus Magasanikbacteria bacterium RIFCSPLOWO2_02_FULL_43_22]OGH72107.1 MAG: hypothetical protein A3C74_04015 [Candidatus Magasanikbacteria bacterium RIFCSPHIGHO2_02_FULL_44_13]OGH72892.1 MAG: hypothetical protein A2921_00490 [Candidatus Magasanikbacteria bacterium RIFCSPLOWO2_01_FULL_43_20b]OGH75676.1 MAG: hypothetical protein A3G00_04260 [Candidatus Magasanikbacteria bacterium RIFCSPLOWO2_12_FULL_43_12]